MVGYFRSIFSCLLLSLFFSINVVSMATAMEKGSSKPHGSFTPNKKLGIYGALEQKVEPYGGLELKEEIKDVKVSSCVSLGSSCIEKINDIIKGADQFVVTFMYRLNSPSLIRTLEEKHLIGIPVIVFLDYGQTYESSMEGSHYPFYVQRLIESVPTSLVKLGGKSFHQKIIISKKAGEEAVIILGSANATFEADNQSSEDLIFIQSNKLATTYLTAFKALMRMEPHKKSQEDVFSEQQVKVFHEHRVRPQESNIDYLEGLLGKLTSSTDKSDLVVGYKGDVASVAISTGFPDHEGTKPCLNVVKGVLDDQHNEFLILFENFISLHEPSLARPILDSLKSKTPKLIVLDKNIHNIAAMDGELELLPMSELPIDKVPLPGKAYLAKIKDIIHYSMIGPELTPITGTLDIKIQTKKVTQPALNTHRTQILKSLPKMTLEGIKTKENKAFLFKPYTGGKFHHKLILQYLSEGPAIVYTGSFHIATNTVLRNSENIIGVRSEGLADEHLASILLNSGLGEDPQVWEFIIRQKRLRSIRTQMGSKESMVLQAAQKILKKCHDNMGRYLDRLERIRSDIQLAASYANQQSEIDKYFDKYIEEFSQGNPEEKLSAIESLNQAVFEQPIHDIFLPHMQKKWKAIALKLDGLDELPAFEILNKHVWLQEIAEWITYVKEEAKFENINIKEEIECIETIYLALNDLEEYEATFSRLHDLSDLLNRFINQ